MDLGDTTSQGISFSSTLLEPEFDASVGKGMPRWWKV